MESEMTSHRLARQLSAVAGGLAIIAMVGFAASCAKEEEEAPETTTPTTTTTTPTTTAPAPPPSPTEKAPRIDPGQPNPFSPTVFAPPAPTAVPGDH